MMIIQLHADEELIQFALFVTSCFPIVRPRVIIEFPESNLRQNVSVEAREICNLLLRPQLLIWSPPKPMK